MAHRRTPGQLLGSQPAFPSSRIEEQVSAKVAYNEGVTRREIFAGLALMGYLANPHHAERIEQHGLDDVAADAAVAQADALCDALAKDGEP